jgi:hypothetical protein
MEKQCYLKEVSYALQKQAKLVMLLIDIVKTKKMFTNRKYLNLLKMKYFALLGTYHKTFVQFIHRIMDKLIVGCL